jgi:hypothetical protein
MRINMPLTFISFLLSVTIGFFLYVESKDLLLVIAFSVSSISILIPSLIYTSKNHKILVNTRVISFIFYLIILSLSFLKMNHWLGQNIYILISGIFLTLYLLITYSLNKSDI